MGKISVMSNKFEIMINKNSGPEFHVHPISKHACGTVLKNAFNNNKKMYDIQVSLTIITHVMLKKHASSKHKTVLCSTLSKF